MPLTYTFGGLTAAQLSMLDTDFTEVGLLGTLPCVATGSNNLTLTPTSTPSPNFALQGQIRFSAIAAASNTGAVTANVDSLGVLNVYKDTPSGPSVLSGGEIVAANYFVLAYDQALNGGAGGYHLETAPASASGTVTSVATGSGLAGGPVTTTGTISLATIANNDLLANISGSTGAPSGNTLSAILDSVFSTPAQGALINRGASLWSASVETSWSPALTFGGSATGLTYATQVGQYMGIGNVLVAMFNIALSAVGSSTGSAALSLPAAAGGGNRIGGGLLTNYSNLTSVTTVPWAQIAASGTTAALVTAGSGTVAALTNSNFANNSAIAGILFYLTG